MKEYAFRLFALFFVITAVYHAVGLFYPVNDAPVWRHALFIAINTFCIYGLLKSPKWFIYFFFILLIQQLNSHGGSLLDTWNNTHRVSWIDLLVVVFTPAIFLLLLSERINSNRKG